MVDISILTLLKIKEENKERIKTYNDLINMLRKYNILYCYVKFSDVNDYIRGHIKKEHGKTYPVFYFNQTTPDGFTRCTLDEAYFTEIQRLRREHGLEYSFYIEDIVLDSDIKGNKLEYDANMR